MLYIDICRRCYAEAGMEWNDMTDTHWSVGGRVYCPGKVGGPADLFTFTDGESPRRCRFYMEQVIMGQGEPPPDEWLWGEVGEEVQPTEEEVQP